MSIKLNLRSKLAILMMSTAMIVSAIPAQSQVLVRDIRTRSAVNNVKDEVNNVKGAVKDSDTARGKFEKEESKKFYDARNKFETEKTAKHYTDAVERLDKLINSLSHIDTDTKDTDLYSAMNTSNSGREKNNELTEDTSTFGIKLSSTGETEMADYLKRYGFFAADELYSGNEALENRLKDSETALYYSAAIVRNTDNEKKNRFDAYADLATRAQNVQDVKSALEVNNALLIENGRNLALLIQLQTAQLNADNSLLRDSIEKEHFVSRIFGDQEATN